MSVYRDRDRKAHAVPDEPGISRIYPLAVSNRIISFYIELIKHVHIFYLNQKNIIDHDYLCSIAFVGGLR
ncbi:MAG: hypothetical protein RQM92_05245 [Candidatus Syntrophopropionicum ammoniitolerans]